MKKVYYGALALVFGLALTFAVSAFTSADKKAQTMYTFEYIGTGFTVAEVEEVDNWQYTPDNGLCDPDDERACKIKVSQAYVDNPGSTRDLNPSIDLSAQLNSTSGKAYVTGLDDGTGVISNSTD